MAITIDQFMAALSGQESGGNPNITNRSGSGAHGLFQIMPENWGPWAEEAGLSRNAPKTPENQYKVARHKIAQYYQKYGNWEDVAAVWYSGQPLGKNQNQKQYYNGDAYPSIREYVNNVMSRAKSSSSNARGSTGANVVPNGRSNMPPNLRPAGIDNEEDSGSTEDSNDPFSIDSDGNGIPDWIESGNDNSVDHFFDVNSLDADKYALLLSQFEYQQKRDKWQADFAMADASWKRAMDERDYYLSIGEQDLARQAQENANYWQNLSLQLQQERENLDRELQKYQIDVSYKSAMANAKNDAERNQIDLARNKDLAAISQMQDETQRAIAGKELGINAFGAETNRMGTLGDLAIRNNEFIHKLYSNPRDHYSLFAMQRGFTPDWDTLAATGQLPVGDKLTVRDPLSVYKPNYQMPSNFDIGAGSAFGRVGQGSSGVGLTPSSFFDQPLGPGPNTRSNFAVGQPNKVVPGKPINPNVLPLPVGQYPGMVNPNIQGGYNTGDTGGGDYGDGYGLNGDGYEFGIPSPPQIAGQPAMPPEYVPGFAEGAGMTNSQLFITGDNRGQKPTQGAKPEAIINPTGAPLGVMNNQQTEQSFDFGTPPQTGNESGKVIKPFGIKNQGRYRMPMPYYPGLDDQRTANSGGQNGVATPRPGFMNAVSNFFNSFANQAPNPMMQQVQNQSNLPAQFTQQANVNNPFFYQQPAVNSQFSPAFAQPYRDPSYEVGIADNGGFGMDDGTGPWKGGNDALAQRWKLFLQNRLNKYRQPTYQVQRFAEGTGFDPLMIQSSQNPWQTQSMYTPQRAGMLMNIGMPMAPGVLNAISGTSNPALNVGSAFSRRGGGTLPSLQTLRGMTGGELSSLQGYVEGPVGMSWNDVMDYINSSTRKLGTANQSMGIRG